jgi:hypothetical protein
MLYRFVLLLLLGLPLVTSTDEKKEKKVEETKSFNISRCCALYALGGAVAGGAAFTFSIPAALGFLGFTAAGPAAGSAAAAWQATMGGTVVGGGLFATLQSIAAAGVGGVATVSMGTATGVAMTQFCETLEEKGFCSPIETMKSKL